MPFHKKNKIHAGNNSLSAYNVRAKSIVKILKKASPQINYDIL